MKTSTLIKNTPLRATQAKLNFPFPETEDWHEQMLSALGVEPGPGWPDRFGKSLREWFLRGRHHPIPTLSLFSGGGGLDIAFHDAGFKALEMVEIDPRFAATLKANAEPGGVFHGASVRCMDINDYVVPEGLKADFIIGGPPCQTFSAAGRRAAGVKGISDPRGTLFEQYVRILRALGPRGFLFENVYGITGAEGGEAWKEIQRTFRESGYTIHWRVLDAADYGTPQHRDRLFIVGLRNDEGEYLFPCPTHGPDSKTPRPFYPAGEAVSGADPKDSASLEINGRWGHLISDIPPGLNYSFYTPKMGHPTPVFAWRSKFSDFMYKADPNVPVRTVKAQGGLYTGPFSWENRHFSVAEMKRLQTFPDDFAVVGKRQVSIQQIGNSVPPQIGRMLALSILHQVFGVEPPFPMHYLPRHRTLGFRTRKRALTEHYSAKAMAAISNIKKNQHDSPLKSKSSFEAVRYLTDSFGLAEDDKKGGLPVLLRYEESGTAITISGDVIGAAAKGGGYGYSIYVEPAPGNDWPIPLCSAKLIARGSEPKLFTALWKALEETIAKKYGIDDLVQLSNYYQYAPKLKARLEKRKGKFPLPPKWRILAEVVSGAGVAVQLSASSLAELWGASQEDVMPALHFLRAIGYEVRSHNTNSQIKKGDFLIPYAFPTLTPRSVQLRKKI